MRLTGGGDAIIVDKFGVQSKLPIALRSTTTAFKEVWVSNELTMQNAKIEIAPSACVNSSAT